MQSQEVGMESTMLSNMVDFSELTFETDVLGAEFPVLLDFWAENCQPCKAIGPVIDSLASDYAGRVVVGKLNVESNPRLSAQFGISSIPTVILFNKGKIIQRFVGLRGKKEFAIAIDGLLGVR